MQSMHVLFDARKQYKNEGGSFDKKIINMKYVTVQNGKATSKFHEPVKTSVFP